MKSLILALGIAAAAFGMTSSASAHEPEYRGGHSRGDYYGRDYYRHDGGRYVSPGYGYGHYEPRYAPVYPSYYYAPTYDYRYAPVYPYGYQPGVSIGIVQPGLSLQFGFGR